MKALLTLSALCLSSVAIASDADMSSSSDKKLLNELYNTYPMALEVFLKPEHPQGLRLDWCKTWGSNCGKPAADQFCSIKGYKTSIGHAIDPRIGLTRILQDNRMVCWGQPCDSFKYIICE